MAGERLSQIARARPLADEAPAHGVPFNWPGTAGNELAYMAEAVQNRHLSGDGPFTKRCQAWLEEKFASPKALLTHSCTAALEMAALLIDLRPGDEVIMPSFTFVSTANAVVLRGARPVFVDIRPDTLNLDVDLVGAAVTERTRAIFVVHYAGVGCDMDCIMAIAERHGLVVVEDAAHAILATYRGRPLGGIGHLACLSFHETKNVISGEGGALLINDARYVERAAVLREKGTNRTAFFEGQVDKYTWVDLGSSYLPSDLIAAFLLGQMERAKDLLEQRRRIWRTYHAGLADLEAMGALRRPVVPAECEANGHIYHVMTRTGQERTDLLAACKAAGIGATFHYVPLHNSPAGLRYGRSAGSLAVTENVSARLLRLPIWPGMTDRDTAAVLDVLQRAAVSSA